MLVGNPHDSITLARGDGESPGTGLRSTRDRTLRAHVVEGLSVTDDGFDAWHDRLAAANVANCFARHGHPRTPRSGRVVLVPRRLVGSPFVTLHWYRWVNSECMRCWRLRWRR